MPLEEKGLTLSYSYSYSSGRSRYGLTPVLPKKLEALRRAVLDQAPPVTLDGDPSRGPAV